MPTQGAVRPPSQEPDPGPAWGTPTPEDDFDGLGFGLGAAVGLTVRLQRSFDEDFATYGLSLRFLTIWREQAPAPRPLNSRARWTRAA